MTTFVRCLLFVFVLTGTATTQAAHPRADIAGTAAAAGQFETLLAAADAAGLVEALTGPGPLTVFAPTDDAFSALPKGTVETLLRPENRAELARVLKFHVLSGRVGSDALADGVSVGTLAGPALTFAATEGGFAVEGARIVTTDVAATNGVIHIIDRVMLPPTQLSRNEAQAAIRDAIATGAPMFNHGDARGTVGVYRGTAERLLADAELDGMERRRLELGLDASRNAQGTRARAWQLRYALDDVFESLEATNRARMSAL